jgi:precorrin-2 dehydrogenase/sirohydrochlorin ferrochelatase
MKNHLLYPIFLNLEHRNCLVIGGGRVAERKVRGLLSAGARVKVIAQSVTPVLSRLARERKITLLKKPFARSCLRGVAVAVCATGDRRLNEEAAAESRRLGIPVNVVDSPEICDFILPAVLRRGALQIAVSTGGGSPALAKRIRHKLARRYGSEYGELIKLMSSMRSRVIAEVPRHKRSSVFNAMIGPRVIRLLRRGERAKVRCLMEKIIVDGAKQKNRPRRTRLRAEAL